METLKPKNVIRRLRGGSQSVLIGTTTGQEVLVKLRGNPQCDRVLANELLATRLADVVGLPVSKPGIIEIDQPFIDANPEMWFTFGSKTVPPPAGLHYACEFVKADIVVDYLPPVVPVRKPEVYAGALVFDKWLCNCDGRQFVFYRRARQRYYSLTLIDHGYVLNASEWSFADSPYRGVPGVPRFYDKVTGWKDFEPWLSRIENFDEGELYKAAENIPEEWYGERADLDRVLETLLERRTLVKPLIASFRDSGRHPFPNWTVSA